MADKERFNLNLENNDESFDLNPDQGDEDFIVDFGEVINTGSVTSYNELTNLPSINDVILQGNKTSEELGLVDDSDIDNLQRQIDAITVSSDVVDVLGTYQDLVDYDTSGLGDNDIVKVLQDSTHGNAMSYYRWDKPDGEWVYVGSEGPFYTKSESDNKFQEKLTAGANITIAPNNTISATDTTYNVATTETAGLMSAEDKTKLNGIADGATANIGTITSVKMNGSTIATSGEADLGTVITQHQDISGKLDVSKVKNTTSTTAGDVYDVTYINTMIGDIETILTTLTTGGGVE